MSLPNPYAVGSAQPAAVPDPALVRPRRGWFVLGAVLIAGAVAVAIAFAVPFFSTLLGPLYTFHTGDTVRLHLEAGTREVVYVDENSLDVDYSFDDPPCVVTAGSSQTSVAVLFEDESGLTAARNGHAWSPLASFKALDEDEYAVSCSIDATHEVPLAAGRDPRAKAGHLGIGILLGLLLFGAGLALCIVTGVRRSRWRRRSAPPPGWAQPAWGQPAWGQPAWGQPAWGQAQWQQPPQSQPTPQWPPPPQPHGGAQGEPPPPPPRADDPWASPPS